MTHTMTFETNRGTTKTVRGEFGQSDESGKAWIMVETSNPHKPFRVYSWSFTNPHIVRGDKGQRLGYFISAI